MAAYGTKAKQTKPVTSNAPLREGKGHLYEGGIREPLIVRWPGKVRAGSVCDTPVISIDFFPPSSKWPASVRRAMPSME